MIRQDLSFAVRTLRKNPAFTLTAVITIGLGIGASTAIFSVVDAVLLRPLPYTHPERLATIQSDMLARHVLNFPIAPGDFQDIRQRATAFESIAAVNASPASFVDTDGKPEQIVVATVTPNFLSTLGATVAFGRDLNDGDASVPPQPPPGVNATVAPPPPRLPTMVILAHDFWQDRFGGDSSVIGKSFQIAGGPATIVGVAQPGLRLEFQAGSGLVGQPDAFAALRINWSTASRINVFLRLIGRLKPGATFAEAQSQLNEVGAYIRGILPIAKTSNTVFRTQPMQADIVHDVRPAILALMGAVLFVLLIACANVANLLLVRAWARERELAVRSALGGSRGALARQMLAESLVLAAGGAALGLLLSSLGISLLLDVAPPSLPRVGQVSIDPAVLAFTAAAALLSALVFGVLPAWRASRPNVAQTLRAGGRSPGLNSGKYLRQGVVVAEVALSFVLLIGSGLMLRSFIALEHVDPGYDPNGVLTFTAASARARTPDARRAFGDAVATQLRAIPGVTAVTAAAPLPLDGSDFNARWGTADVASDPTRYRQATIHAVRPGYFQAMRARMLAGRAFDEADQDTASRAVIIDDLLAAKAFPGQALGSVIGKQLLMRITTPEAQLYQIVGVTVHERHLSLAEPGREAAFVSDGSFGFGAAARWAVRTTGDPMRLVPAVRAAVAQVDGQAPVAQIKPMSAYVDRAMAPTRFSLVLIGVFGAVAAILAAVGLYGVLSTSVRQRTAEIGVRLAFGATSASIFRLMIGHGLALSAVGIAIGLAAALGLTGVLQRASMLVAIAPTDPATYAAIAILFVSIATLACWIPAHRAASLDPNVALREE
ncbi:MAG TPA: ABC transporter permease [Gemmatimonadaceae bacterium]|nr:ABC transporter permease [Gemmatimonadaceae bacterium]